MTPALNRPWYHKKKFTIPLVVFVLLLVARMALVPVAQKELNQFLATFSPTLEFHMNDLDVHVIRGAYSFEGITGKVKGQKKEFLRIEKVDVSMAWREIFKGKIVTDIEVIGPDFSYTKALNKAFADASKNKKDADTAKEKLFPVKIERVDVKNGNVTLDDYPGLDEKSKFKVTDIEGRITNLTPEKKFPLSFFNVQAKLFGQSLVKTTGHLNSLTKPIAWDVDGELRQFDMTSANKFLKRKVPLTFTKGKLDVYAEAESKKGAVEGYVKPFLENIDVVKTDEKFKGPKHWAIEVVTALGNLILRASDKPKSVATKIPFSMDKSGVHVDSGEALTKAIQHGFEQKLKPGIENKYDLE